MALIIGTLKSILSAKEVIVSEEVPAKIVEKSDTL